jgi:hypothetical protein
LKKKAPWLTPWGFFYILNALLNKTLLVMQETKFFEKTWFLQS